MLPLLTMTIVALALALGARTSAALDVPPLWIVAILVGTLPVTLHLAAGLSRLMMRCALQPIRRCRTPLSDDPPLVVPVILRSLRDLAAIRACVDVNLPLLRTKPMILLADLPDDVDRVARTDDELVDGLRAVLAGEIEHGDVAVLFRRRRFDPVDQVWRGWERKRGKIMEFCRLVSGDQSTDFVDPLPDELRGMPAFVTIDVDTRLVPTTIGALSASVDRHAAIVVPVIEDVRSDRPSLFERLQAPYWLTRPFDPPPSFNQLYLGHDLFFGKGLIVVDRFLSRLEGRIPERSVLSHDHLEAVIAGAVSEPRAIILEDVPASRRQWESRQHRWMRGDMQIVPWILGRHLPLIARFHLLLVVTAQLVSLGTLVTVATLIPVLPASEWNVAVAIALFMVRPTLPLLPLELLRLALAREPADVRRQRMGATLSTECASWLLAILYAPRDAAISLHACGLVAWRLLVSGRNMLAWSDASRAEPLHSGWRLAATTAGTCAVVAAPLADLPAPWMLVALWTLGPLLAERLRAARREPAFRAGTAIASLG